MKTILEYLLGKNKKTLSEKYYVLWPSFNIYKKLDEIYRDKKITVGVNYWILSEFETKDLLKNFERDDLLNNLNIYEIPDNYDIKDVKNDLIKRHLHPSTDFDRIHIDKLL